MAGEASWAITLPNQFEPFGNIMQRGISQQGEQNQMLYSETLRKQQKEEQDKWKKLNLIQDFTDISKHQTASDVANAIGNKKMAEVIQKHTLSIGSKSPEQLQYELSKDVSETISSMDGVRSELEMGEEAIKQLKQAIPNINAEQMAKDWRADVLGRRLKNENEFNPPLTIQPSQIDFSNLETLSKYVVGNKSLLKAINDDKGDDVVALMGRQGDYTKYEGKLKAYQKLGYDPNKVDKEGFYTGSRIPSFEMKSSILPKETMTDANGNPLQIIDEDVYKRYAQDAGVNIELIAATKNEFPGYDNLSSQQKEYAKRNTLFKIISANDQNRMNPTANVRPPRTNINVNSGGGQSSVNDIYSTIDAVATEKRDSGVPYTQINLLPLDAQKVVIDFANSVRSKYSGSPDLGQADLKIIKDNNGNIGVWKADDNSFIGNLPRVGTNLKVQPGVKEKREVISKGEQKPTIQKPTKKDPLGLGL